jgi:hypothetical protein
MGSKLDTQSLANLEVLVPRPLKAVAAAANQLMWHVPLALSSWLCVENSLFHGALLFYTPMEFVRRKNQLNYVRCS